MARAPRLRKLAPLDARKSYGPGMDKAQSQSHAVDSSNLNAQKPTGPHIKPAKGIVDLPNEILGQIFDYLLEEDHDQAFFGLERRLTCDPSRQMRGDFVASRTAITTGDRKKGLALYATNPMVQKDTIDLFDIRFCQISTRLREVALERLFAHTRFKITPEVWGYKPWSVQKNYLSEMDQAIGGLALAHVKELTVYMEVHFDVNTLTRHDNSAHPCDRMTHRSKREVLMLGQLLEQVFERRCQIDLCDPQSSTPDKSISRHHIGTCLEESYYDPLRRSLMTHVPFVNVRVLGPAARSIGIVFSLMCYGYHNNQVWEAFKDQAVHDLLSGWLDRHVFEPFADRHGWKLEGGFVEVGGST